MDLIVAIFDLAGICSIKFTDSALCEGVLAVLAEPGLASPSTLLDRIERVAIGTGKSGICRWRRIGALTKKFLAVVARVHLLPPSVMAVQCCIVTFAPWTVFVPFFFLFSPFACAQRKRFLAVVACVLLSFLPIMPITDTIFGVAVRTVHLTLLFCYAFRGI